jgi:hypothetical protein
MNLFSEFPSSLEDSPARTFPPQAKARALPGSDLDSGFQCSMQFEESSPDMSWLKMSVLSTLAASTPFSAGWKKRATPQKRSWWVLTTWERPTDASESSSSPNAWPTPRASEFEGRGGSNRTPGTGGATLSQTARTAWPTPTVSGNTNKAGASQKSGDGLRTRAVEASWPTPSAGVFNDNENLENWQARRDKIKTQKKNGNGFGIPLTIATRLEQPQAGALNPAWVEQLQGFPNSWTEVPEWTEIV